MSIATGTKLRRYEIRLKIGEGGMGEVYLAEDTKLEPTVALKILPVDVAANVAVRRDPTRKHRSGGTNHEWAPQFFCGNFVT